MNDAQQDRFSAVDASPVKSFFVSMLTHDIKLEEAILDLLDNCVDGILRSGGGNGSRPYEGFKADIVFEANHFSISDNCGGIPWDLRQYAFRMGRSPERPDDAPGSVGVYGIGMKRAIFKIGRHCIISTRNGDDQYEVEITPKWIRDETSWEIPVRRPEKPIEYRGTKILVKDLYPGIAKTFDDEARVFESELVRMISTHYAYIIEKGFEVTINGVAVKPRTTRIVSDDREEAGEIAVRPFVFKGTYEGVDIFLAVGFTRPIPSENELEEEQGAAQYSSVEAGWTILCNDRAVLHCDRSELTGWGEAGVPRYHNQFIAVSGILELRSADSGRLPTTTTKRGIDASSTLYLQVKNKMREGMRMFTNYTNKWKGREDESKSQIQGGSYLSLDELRQGALEMPFNVTKKPLPGSQYKPKLPMPPRIEPTKSRISFVREVAKIDAIAEFIGEADIEPSEVGEFCFDAVYDEASR